MTKKNDTKIRDELNKDTIRNKGRQTEPSSIEKRLKDPIF